MVVNVNVKQIQVAATLDQLSRHPTNCQLLNHWLVGSLIGMDRQMEERVAVEERRINGEGQEDEEMRNGEEEDGK